MTSYTFPFSEHDTVIELGGGNRPYFRPNLDVRCGENIDIVADFNEPLPIPSNSYDGVFSCYCIEHLSWRKVRLFLSEVLRILKPNGKAVFITANTERQMQYVLEHDEWNDDCSCIIFGDQDYPENTHRNSLCPRYAIKLLAEMGFSNVTVLPTGTLHTDMIIEAQKVDSIINFDRDYFDNPHFYGPNSGLYRDHPTNWIVHNKVVDMDPKSVLEIGCGRGYVIKKLESEGILCTGLDISDHCFLTRVTDSVIKYDICDIPWPYGDKQFDVCLSHGVLDLIPQNKLSAVLTEIQRVSHRGLHSSNIGYCKIPNQIMITNDEMIKGSLAINVPMGDDNLLKLNIGSYTVMAHNGWVNTDIIDLEQWAIANHYKFLKVDCTVPLPFSSNQVDLITTSHMLEHLTWDEGLAFLKECYRIMKYGSTMRISVPDTEILVKRYIDNTLTELDEMNINAATKDVSTFKLWSFLVDGHKTAYDWYSLLKIGLMAGFAVERKSFNVGHPIIIKETMDFLQPISIYVEMTKA